MSNDSADSRRPHHSVVRHYYVDEAGDGVLFGRGGKVQVGCPGCSRFFILGLADVRNPEGLEADMTALRVQLLADPYFRRVPSMQPEAGKTALYFHAKDDVPEVRREVFGLLRKHDCRFLATVKGKLPIVKYVKQRNQREPGYRYHPNELYDFMVRRLFGTLLHKHDEYRIWFAKRYVADKAAALSRALEALRDDYCDRCGIQARSCLQVHRVSPEDAAGLQAADYFLWALQRLFEMREDRYLEYLQPMVRLVAMQDGAGEGKTRVYTQRKPLLLAALEEMPGI